MLLWIIGTIAIFAKYTSDERSFLWMGVSGYCGVLLLFSYILGYIMANYIKTKFSSFILLVLAIMLLYPLVMIGYVAADVVQGPVIKKVVIQEKWDPRRGGDQVTTSDGDHYEIGGSQVTIETGHKYVIKVFEHSGLILHAREIR
ncbi:hypothetical protein [Brevibacillus sp. NRS-1366]|uniref:hypothetical protein n=1 Tax=Brevibacillus sp. NRS-1366 TaxID=3233899 RepID=UPI003D1B1067